VASVGLVLAHLTAPLFYMLSDKVIEGLYYAHWLLWALGCSAVIDFLMEKRRVLYLILSIAVIMTLSVLFQIQGVFLVSAALLVGFLIILFYLGKEKTHEPG